MNPNVVGALVNSALYLVCVFVAGIVTAHPIAWKLAVAAMGVTFFVYVLSRQPRVAVAAVFLSWMLGAAAGINLLF